MCFVEAGNYKGAVARELVHATASLARCCLDMNEFYLSIRRRKAEDVHRADCHANAAPDTGAVRVRNLVLLQREAHYVNAHLAVPRALTAGDALVIRRDREST